MKRNFLLSILLFSSSALAHTSFVGTFSMGPFWESAGDTQTFYLAPELEKTYDPDNSTQTGYQGEIFLGAQSQLSKALLGQLGLAVLATSNVELSGMIWDDADPQFDNFEYHYKIQHTYVGAKGKLLWEAGHRVQPWISASAGVAFNKSYDFVNRPTLFEAIANSNFGSNSQTAFSYTLGLGVQGLINSHWQLGVGYEFADWGKSSLDRASGQTLGSGLSLDHLYTQGLIFNVTYLCAGKAP